jgi:forespore regulator of the sigma-K checkpoint
VFGLRVIKELKKKIKRRRRAVLQLGMLAAVFTAASAAGLSLADQIRLAALHVPDTAAPASMSLPAKAEAADQQDRLTAAASSDPSSPREAALQALSEWKGEVEVVLHRTFWCGEDYRMLGRLPAEEAAGLLKSRREWDALFEPAGRLVIQENSEDLSPACRETAYIGMDAEGNLSLFDGPPRKDNVIRTFFQLDVPALESSISPEQLKELMQGIRVTDKEKMSSVLSAYSQFAASPSRNVMKSE